MSWANSQGTAIETPRRPRCREADSLLNWVESARSGTERQARHRALVAWLLVRVAGMTEGDTATGEQTSDRTVRRRLAAVDSAVDGLE